jgi:hydrogenase/urease accessory protein HupE
MIRGLVWIGLLVSLLPVLARAHPLAPALLELKELEGDRYAVLWRTSVARVQGANVQPQLPSACRALGPARRSAEDNQSQVLRWEVQCGPGGLVGQTLAVSGLERSRISVILRLQPRQGEVVTRLLDLDQPSYTVPTPATPPPVFRGYLQLGIEHLLLGFDHVLFVLGLLLLVRHSRLLVATVTAFTLGHSVTLALATLGFVRVNPALTELAIAASIMVLALELLRPNPHSLLRRRPWLVALAFGLLHGLGFAGALAEVGLPAGEIPQALLAFNLGIELAQLLLVTTWLLLAWSWRRVGARPLPAALTLVVPAYGIGTLAAFWCLERTAALWL